MVAFPYFFFLEMIGPAIEVLGYLSFLVLLLLGSVTTLYAVAFIMVAIVFGMVISIAAVCLEELTFRRYRRASDLARLLLLSFAENFGYRQLSTWWRFRGLLNARKMGWGAMVRKGFTPSAPPAE
jgi:hypothetical protein